MKKTDMQELKLEISMKSFESPALKTPEELTDTELELVLLVGDRLIRWIRDVKKYALAEAMNGKKYRCFKLVETQPRRRYTSRNEVAGAVVAAGYDPFEKKLLGISAMTSLLGREKFDELLEDKTCRNPGKPQLVIKTDRRPAIRVPGKKK